MNNGINYADYGTIAHALAAMCLTEGKPAAAYEGRVIRSEDYEHAQLSPSSAHRWMRCAGSHALEKAIPFRPRKFNHQVDKEMVIGVQLYLDNLAKYTTARGIVPMVEQRLYIGHLTGEEGAFGTGDGVVIDEAAFELQVHDLKFGEGVEVEAEDNEQLQMYLLAALEDFGEFCNFQRFRGVIHQPRVRKEPSECDWTRAELMAFKARCVKAAQLARNVKENASQGNVQDHARVWVGTDILVPGDKQCKFCSAKATCPALQGKITETVVAEFADLNVATVDRTKLTPIPADNARLARLKSMTPLIRSWCDAIDATAESEILNGRPVPGFKAVQGKRGNRAWRDPAEAEAAMKSMRLKSDVMYKSEIISPTKAEELSKLKVIGAKQWTKLQPLITQSPGKPTVVEESDKRPALELKPTSDDFTASDESPESLV